MYVVLVYDVRKKRVQKVMKICRKYLNHLQNSVFEGNITEAKLTKLKGEIKNVIDVKTDSVCVFRMDSTRYISKEQIGVIPLYEHII
ncbi:MAG: CRISPR-associated endonuclease Cas2 [Ruminococcus flavefaciens]|nr:CRISPR-associated endonuclease Cas2 [Ruminococcus flavefaciens]MCM1363206.1 CRISPR-associated endonuclease Cas2 [Clostridiales bacterium]